MSTTITLEDIRRAWKSQDPALPRLVVSLANMREPYKAPRKDGVLTFSEYYRTIRSWQFARKTKDEQAHYRMERMKELESRDPEVPLPDRVKVWTIVMELWETNGPYERSCLLEIIEKVPLRWGAWRALKRIFKQAEESHDTEVFGAIAARVDQSFQNHRDDEVTRRTIAYMRRRAWRYLRRQAETLPATYADAAVDILRFYTITSTYQWRTNWISSHIWFHDRGGYSRNSFSLPWKIPSMIKSRAYSDLWLRTPRPLFTLLERAKAEQVRQFAVEALKTDFRASLRDVEPSWVIRLINVRSQIIDDFVVWLLKNVPRFEQGAFRDLGLHEPVLGLLSSPSKDARAYAAAYARTHARDLPLEQLIRLVDNDNEAVRQLAIDLIQDRDPREEVGLDAWGRLLETKYGYDLATSVLRKHFGTRELHLDWFKERLLSKNNKVFKFASELFPKVHTPENLEAQFFIDLVEDERVIKGSKSTIVNFAFTNLENYPIEKIGVEFLKRSYLQSMTTSSVQQWIRKDRIDVRSFGIDFFKALAYEPNWKADAWIKELKESGRSWAEDLSFSWGLSTGAFKILGDRRFFSPQELGFKWLMELAESSYSGYHNFAMNYMIEAFKPSDFAPEGSANDQVTAGCDYLWEATIADGEETPLSRFTQSYLRHHHAHIGKKLKEKPFEKDALIPESFLNFDRVRVLMNDSRKRIRDFALELALWDFARWNPSMEDIVELCENPYSEVFSFMSKALLATEKEEHKHYRIDTSKVSSDSVYRFCESLDKGTRGLGMKLISSNPKLADPTELFRLSESPDRQVQAFVIRSIWSLYRDRGITMHWTPPPMPVAKPKKGMSNEEKQAQKEAKLVVSSGPPQKPDNLPAEPIVLRDFMRTILFTLAPARLPKSSKSKDGQGDRLKPLPARKAKLSLIEMIRDIAVEDKDFAVFVTPLLEEFMASHGKSEHDACLVALTRIDKAHGDLQIKEGS